jgi:hypothetical protein
LNSGSLRSVSATTFFVSAVNCENGIATRCAPILSVTVGDSIAKKVHAPAALTCDATGKNGG